MKLQNGYKAIFDKAADGKHTIYASKTGLFKDAEEIGTFEADQYNLIYEKQGKLYHSSTGIPADTDATVAELDKLFIEQTTETPAETETTSVTGSVETPDVEEIDEPDEDVIDETEDEE